MTIVIVPQYSNGFVYSNNNSMLFLWLLLSLRHYELSQLITFLCYPQELGEYLFKERRHVSLWELADFLTLSGSWDSTSFFSLLKRKGLKTCKQMNFPSIRYVMKLCKSLLSRFATDPFDDIMYTGIRYKSRTLG